jgi:branched-chain amino acid transport system ATP-binding protein
MLDVQGLEARYGQAVVLQGVSLSVTRGTVCLLLGRNGAGKSTTVKSLIGLVRPSGGSVNFLGENVAGQEPYRIARRGMGYVPEERRIFTDLTVMENLNVGARAAVEGAAWTPERLFAVFPNLAEMRHRSAGRMSGGEQQMLAIARTLMGNPTLLLLDEPSEGLSPLIVEQLADTLLLLKREGTTMLLAEQNLHFARLVGDDAVVLERGRVVWSGTAAALTADADAQRRYLSL